ncbi:MAG: RluA family pseudouridine synthase [Firmicutes bacterium]|nr:RluA family pseudouridine synthase [Bacillota bacterium]
MQEYRFHVAADAGGQRLDSWLTAQDLELSRSQIQRLIGEGRVQVDGLHVDKSSHRLRGGEEVIITVPPPRPLEVVAEQIPLTIVYEDAYLAVINKPQGMVTHPGPGNYSGTLVNALLYHMSDLSGINGVLRPGIVHRLDKDTSGLLVVAKNDLAHQRLAAQLKARQVERGYLALVHGNIKQERGTINAPIARHPVLRKQMAVIATGREAITHYQVRERFGDYTLVELQLETGRTHQIRVHMAHLGHPVVGDPVYGPKKVAFNLSGQLLHAWRLGFSHPITQEIMRFSADIPPHFQKVLDRLRQGLTTVDKNSGNLLI